jgi:acetyl-CoA C-acetyltransferase
MATPVIVSAVRTAIGTLGGALAQTPATKLGAIVAREAVRRAALDPAAVDEMIMGHVLTAGHGLNPARVAALEAGLPKEVPSYAVNKACGSGLKAVVLAAQEIQLDQVDVVVAGGMESMSGAPYLLKKARFGVRMGHDELLDSMIADGLTCPITFVHMGVTAENVAAKYGIGREEQDEFAAESQQKTAAAQKAGKFKAEIVPIAIPAKKGEAITFDIDEHPRGDTTAQRLAGLKPAFKRDGGSVTAGNASGINDGAAAVVVMSDRKARELGLTPLATIRAYASAGVDPSIMGMGPWPACEKALAKAGLRREEIDLWELNEAFAAQSLGVLRELRVPRNRVNVHGGAIALGHPIGASGGRVLVTLLHALADRDARLGVASLCIGGGQGIAMIVERTAA